MNGSSPKVAFPEPLQLNTPTQISSLNPPDCMAAESYLTTARAQSFNPDVSAQRIYGLSLREAIISGHDRWRSTLSFQDTLQHIQQERFEIALVGGKGPGNSFGQLRNRPIITRMNGEFKSLSNELKPRATFEPAKSFQSGLIERWSGDSQLKSLRAQDKPIMIDDKAVALTEIVFDLSPLKKQYEWEVYFTTEPNNEFGFGCIFHPSVGDSTKLLNKAGAAFESVMQKDFPKNQDGAENLVKDIAEIHWLMAQAAPFERGSAAIAEMMAKIALLHHDLEFTAWKPGIMADIEAMRTPLEDFKSNYKNLFIRPPTFGSVKLAIEIRTGKEEIIEACYTAAHSAIEKNDFESAALIIKRILRISDGQQKNRIQEILQPNLLDHLAKKAVLSSDFSFLNQLEEQDLLNDALIKHISTGIRKTLLTVQLPYDQSAQTIQKKFNSAVSQSLINKFTALHTFSTDFDEEIANILFQEIEDKSGSEEPIFGSFRQLPSYPIPLLAFAKENSDKSNLFEKRINQFFGLFSEKMNVKSDLFTFFMNCIESLNTENKAKLFEKIGTAVAKGEIKPTDVNWENLQLDKQSYNSLKKGFQTPISARLADTNWYPLSETFWNIHSKDVLSLPDQIKTLFATSVIAALNTEIASGNQWCYLPKGVELLCGTENTPASLPFKDMQKALQNGLDQVKKAAECWQRPFFEALGKSPLPQVRNLAG